MAIRARHNRNTIINLCRSVNWVNSKKSALSTFPTTAITITPTNGNKRHCLNGAITKSTTCKFLQSTSSLSSRFTWFRSLSSLALNSTSTTHCLIPISGVLPIVSTTTKSKLIQRSFCSAYGSREVEIFQKVTQTHQIAVSFIPTTGHFRLRLLDHFEVVLHYWQSVDALLHTLLTEVLATDEQTNAQLREIKRFQIFKLQKPQTPLSPQAEVKSDFSSSKTVTTTTDSEHSDPNRAAVIDDNDDKEKVLNRYFRLSPSMPLGYLFVALDPFEVSIIGLSGRSLNSSVASTTNSMQSPIVLFKFDLTDSTLAIIRQWADHNSTQSGKMFNSAGNGAGGASMLPLGTSAASFAKHELSFLEQEKQKLKSTFDPLQVQFNSIVEQAKKDAHRRFKMGGLFLLSAQFGFVARLTWFEYSWDIMEPVTWMLTYATMVGTFAYYIVTSEEYIVPMVERRMIVSRFWKLVKAEQFDVRRYRLLRDELVSIEKQIRAIQREHFL